MVTNKVYEAKRSFENNSPCLSTNLFWIKSQRESNGNNYERVTMDIKKEFGTSKAKEQEGIWSDFGDGCQVKIARIGNPEYQKTFRKISKPHQKAIRRGSLNDEVAEKLLVEAMAEAIVIDWKGLQEDGKELKYSKTEAIRILTTYKDFRDQVSEIANDMESFKAVEDESAEKN